MIWKKYRQKQYNPFYPTPHDGSNYSSTTIDCLMLVSQQKRANNPRSITDSYLLHCEFSVKYTRRYFIVLQYHAIFDRHTYMSERMHLESYTKGSHAKLCLLDRLQATPSAQFWLLGQHRESVVNTNIFNSPKLPQRPSFFKKLIISQKLSMKIFF